jgi:hypothetical protein
LGADPYELEDSAQITPVSGFGAFDCGLQSLDIFFLEITLGILPPLRSWSIICF